MERYDGKTKRDYIKYGLIALGVVVVIVGLSLLSHFLRKSNPPEPDYMVVIGSEEAFSQEMTEQLEARFAELVGDRNGDGKAVVEVEALRLVDYAQAKLDAAKAREDYNDALAMGLSVPLEEQFAGVSGDGDFSRLLLYMTEQDCYLYLLSDQSRGSFRGAAKTYCEQEYFIELPTEMQDPEEPCRMELTGADFLEKLGLGDIPFYGCVLDGGDSEQERLAVSLLRQLTR